MKDRAIDMQMLFKKSIVKSLVLSMLAASFAATWTIEVSGQESRSVPANRLRAPAKAKQSWIGNGTSAEKTIRQEKAAATQKKAAVDHNSIQLASHSEPTVSPVPAKSKVVGTSAKIKSANHGNRRSVQQAVAQTTRTGRGPIHRTSMTQYIEGGFGDANYCDAGGCEPSCGCESCCSGFGYSGCGDACGIGCGCGGTIDGCCPPCNPFGWFDWRRSEIFVGVQGFKGAPNFSGSGTGTQREGSGSFGFHQGFNFGRPVYWIGCGEFGWQFGLRAAQSNLSGSEFTNDERTQLFLTGGMFRRVDCGLQWGFAFDYLSDQWYYDVDLLQLRAELGWKVAPNNEFGFRFSQSMQSSSSLGQVLDNAGAPITVDSAFVAVDQYRLYHRRILNNGITAEVSGGLTGDSDIMLGTYFDVPLTRSLGLRTSADYLIPNEGSNAFGNQHEGWNLSMSIVWFPCGKMCGGRDYYRPMFDVADNGSFMLRRR